MALKPKFCLFLQALLQEIQDSLAQSGEVVQETVSSIETVRSFATEEEESQRYERALAKTCQLKNQRDMERALYLLIRRVSWKAGVGLDDLVGAFQLYGFCESETSSGARRESFMFSSREGLSSSDKGHPCL